MTLRFTRHRAPRSLDKLTPVDQDQVVACAKAYDGSDRTAAECLPNEDDEEAGLFGLEAWDVEDDAGAVVYNVWIYFVDSGSIFTAGTTTGVGSIVQCHLDGGDSGVATALAAAHAAHGAWPEGSCMARMVFP